jgi:hypothetical protein
MAAGRGWNVDHNGDVAVDFSEDVAECNLVTAAGAVCGAGEVAAGAVSRDIDISVDGARGEYHTRGKFIGLCAAAITDLAVPIKPAAAGTITPATTDQDYCVGWPLNLQATVGGQVEYIWAPGYYAV